MLFRGLFVFDVYGFFLGNVLIIGVDVCIYILLLIMIFDIFLFVFGVDEIEFEM